jgi:hypothetical protein
MVAPRFEVLNGCPPAPAAVILYVAVVGAVHNIIPVFTERNAEFVFHAEGVGVPDMFACTATNDGPILPVPSALNVTVVKV